MTGAADIHVAMKMNFTGQIFINGRMYKFLYIYNFKCCCKEFIYVAYSGKLSREKSFTNFADLRTFVKVFSVNF